MITCPNDSFMYALIAEHEESVFNIFGSEYPDTVVLAAGYKVGVVAKRDGKRTTVVTTDGEKIKIKKVACIQYNPTKLTTTTPLDLCDMCKIDDIEPENLQDGQFFDSTPLAPTGKCISTSVRCFQQGGFVCTSVSISSVTPTGSTVIATMNGNEVTARLDCESDGLYSSGTATKITQLACEFTGCVLPCQTCDPNSLTPAMLPPLATFQVVDQGAGGCQQVRVRCGREDAATCDLVAITATGAAGTDQLVSATSANQVSAFLTCGADRLYETGMQTSITALSCDYENCVSCRTCDINTIAPASMPTGTEIVFEELAEPPSCIRTLITCRRTDGATCTSVTVQATTTTGTRVLGTSTDAMEAEGAANCGISGSYSASGAQFTALTCVFTGCTLPCSTCDITTIQPTGLAMGEVFQSTEMGAAGACKMTQATCARDDGYICDSIELRGDGGVVLGSSTNSGTASATLTCGSDVTYSGGGLNPIISLSCVYNGCKQLCERCDINAIAPTGLGMGQSFVSDVVSPPGSCIQSEVYCLSSQPCLRIELNIQGGMNLAYSEFTDYAGKYVSCGNDGVLQSDIGPVTQFSCFFDCP